MTAKLQLGLMLVVLLAPVHGRATDDNAPPDGLMEKTVALKDKTVAAGENIADYTRRIVDEGDNILYLSGYAYHDRGTYSPEKIDGFNEAAWGGGFGRTLIDENGNSDALFALAFLDSHSDVQAQIGYAREWRWRFAEHAAVGGGFVAMLVTRSDMFNNIPFPVILPIASIEVRGVAIMATYIPKLSAGEGANGNVLYLFGRINLGR
jgi:palmitoyl transferase